MKRGKNRQRISLKSPPEEVSALRGFPLRTLRRGTVLWRVTRAGRNPWWFSSSLKGRFDLLAPLGTCYLAMDALAALMELVGPDITNGAVSRSFFSQRRLRRLALPRTHRVSNLTDRRALGFGVTAEVHTITPYTRPQAWAKALKDSGAQGVLYLVRHDPSFTGRGVGLFGKAGERRSWKRGRELAIDAKLESKLNEKCHVRVLPVPRASELRISD